MSFLKASLEKRIKELRKSIEAQSIELAAYEQVLALETGKPMVRTGAAFAPTTMSHKKKASAPTKKSRISEEGMSRIIAATKKRWALQRAGKVK